MSDVIEAKVHAAVADLGEPFEWMDCDPELADTAKFCEAYGIPPAESANTIIVASKKEPKVFAACVVTATTRLDVNKTVRKLLGSRKASFASAEETKELTGMLIGGVTIFALPPGLPIYIDARIAELERVVLGGGSRSKKVRLAPRALEKISGARFIAGLAKDVPEG